MKKNILLLSVSFILGCQDKIVMHNEVKEIDGVTFKDDNPYTGRVEADYENGQPMWVKRFKNGLLHGSSLYYYKNNMIRAKCTFEDGSLVGKVYEYDENGNELQFGIDSIK